MAGLMDELIADSGRAGGMCSVRKWLDSLPADEQAEWEAVFANEAITAAAIARAFERRNIPIGQQPTQRHAQRIRRGTGCKCDR